MRRSFAKFPPARRRKIKARAAELIAEEYALRDLRLAKEVTQEQVAGGWAAGRSMSRALKIAPT